MNQRGHKTERKIKPLHCVFYISLLVAIIVCSNTKAGKAKDSQLIEGGTLRLVSVKPTVFFIKEGNALLQVVEVNIENTSEPVEASLDVRLDGKQQITALGKVKKGKATFQVHIPDIAEPKPVEFVLKAKGKVQNRSKSTWQPKRHWQVYIVPITHHDLGYTDTIENVLNLYDSFYDNVLRFCEETNDWPEESKYRYTLEGTWSIQHFMENRPKEVLDKLGKYIKNGRIEVGRFLAMK